MMQFFCKSPLILFFFKQTLRLPNLIQPWFTLKLFVYASALFSVHNVLKIWSGSFFFFFHLFKNISPPPLRANALPRQLIENGDESNAVRSISCWNNEQICRLILKHRRAINPKKSPQNTFKKWLKRWAFRFQSCEGTGEKKKTLSTSPVFIYFIRIVCDERKSSIYCI